MRAGAARWRPTRGTSTGSSLAAAISCLADVDSLRNCTQNPELIKQLKLDEAAVAQSRQLATSSAAAANAALQNNAVVLEESLTKVAAGPVSWGVIFGGDVSRRAAENEIARVKDAPNLAISGDARIAASPSSTAATPQRMVYLD